MAEKHLDQLTICFLFSADLFSLLLEMILDSEVPVAQIDTGYVDLVVLNSRPVSTNSCPSQHLSKFQNSRRGQTPGIARPAHDPHLIVLDLVAERQLP